MYSEILFNMLILNKKNQKKNHYQVISNGGKKKFKELKKVNSN